MLSKSRLPTCIIFKNKLLHRFFSRIYQLFRKTLWNKCWVVASRVSGILFLYRTHGEKDIKLLCWYDFLTYLYFWFLTKHSKDQLQLLFEDFEWNVLVESVCWTLHSPSYYHRKTDCHLSLFIFWKAFFYKLSMPNL